MAKRNINLPTETVDIAQLKPHPQNYRAHPEEQLEHLMKSIEENGLYRNIVIAKDSTILAGHGVVEALTKLKKKTVQVIKLNVSPSSTKALKVLAGDNEIGYLAEIDDRALSELLKSIGQDAELLGTGYDTQMVAALAMATRPSNEVADMNEAAEWLGMPEFEPNPMGRKITVNFDNDEDVQKFAELVGVKITPKTRGLWYPPREKRNMKQLKIEG
jgi:hypothetical protein